MNIDALIQSIQNSLGSHIPQLLGALAILLIGWVIAVLTRAGVRRGLAFVGLNRRFSGLTGQALDLESLVATVFFWTVLLLTLVGVFNSLDLGLISSPFNAFTTQLFEYAPHLLAGLVLAVVAWLLAALVRAVINKAPSVAMLDQKVSQQAGMAPMGQNLGQAAFWLVILLFVPAILNALQMQGLLEPLRAMITKTLDMVPNALAALVIGGVGWIVAVVLRNLTTQLLRSSGIDKLGGDAGLGGKVQLSGLGGTLVFAASFLPSLIAALDALKLEAVSRPATDMLGMLLNAIPHIIAAGLILVITWLVASFASALLARLLASMGFDSLPRHLGLSQTFSGAGASALVGRIALFFAMLFATTEAANQLGFMRLSDVVATFVHFGGDVLLGSVILVIGFWLANLAYRAIDSASGTSSSGMANVARFAILSLVLAMGLRAMGIADDIVNLAFGLTLGAVAVAVALSFGLGGREAAGKLMEHWLEKLKK